MAEPTAVANFPPHGEADRFAAATADPRPDLSVVVLASLLVHAVIIALLLDHSPFGDRLEGGATIIEIPVELIAVPERAALPEAREVTTEDHAKPVDTKAVAKIAEADVARAITDDTAEAVADESPATDAGADAKPVTEARAPAAQDRAVAAASDDAVTKAPDTSASLQPFAAAAAVASATSVAPAADVYRSAPTVGDDVAAAVTDEESVTSADAATSLVRAGAAETISVYVAITEAERVRSSNDPAVTQTSAVAPETAAMAVSSGSSVADLHVNADAVDWIAPPLVDGPIRQPMDSAVDQMHAYARRLEAHLERSGALSPEASRRLPSAAAIILFTVHKDGSVSAVRIVKRSGNRALDRKAQALVTGAAPFPSIPEALNSETFMVRAPIRLPRN